MSRMLPRSKAEKKGFIENVQDKANEPIAEEPAVDAFVDARRKSSRKRKTRFQLATSADDSEDVIWKRIRKPIVSNNIQKPFELSHEDVLKGLIDRWLRPGNPPRKCQSSKWNEGLQFLYFTYDGEELSQWYVLRLVSKLIAKMVKF